MPRSTFSSPGSGDSGLTFRDGHPVLQSEFRRQQQQHDHRPLHRRRTRPATPCSISPIPRSRSSKRTPRPRRTSAGRSCPSAPRPSSSSATRPQSPEPARRHLDVHRRERRAVRNVASSSYSATTGLTTVVLNSAVIGAAAPSEVDITLASGTAATYSSGVVEVADDSFTLPGDLTAVAPVGSMVSLTLASAERSSRPISTPSAINRFPTRRPSRSTMQSSREERRPVSA